MTWDKMQEGAISMFKLWSVKTTIILRRQSRCRQFRDDDQEEDQEKLDAKGWSCEKSTALQLVTTYDW